MKIGKKGWNITSKKGLATLKRLGYKKKDIKTVGDKVYFYN